MEELESSRITISIGLLAGFLTLIYSIDKFIPKESKVLSLWITSVVYVSLAFTCICLFAFLVIKAFNLRYDHKNHGFLNISPSERLGNIFFDYGVHFALFSPFLATYLIYSVYVPPILMKWLNVSDNMSLLLSLIPFLIYIIGTFILIFLKRRKNRLSVAEKPRKHL